MKSKGFKIALVVENLFSMGGANVVNLELANLFPEADIFSLYGSKKFVERYLRDREVRFSFLNRFPFIQKLYTFYLPLWPVAVETFDLSNYDLVISSSHGIAKGCITSQESLHISYIHTPLRYLWDLKDIYSKYGLLKAPFLNYLRIWDVMSSSRPDILVSNSKFVAQRCKRYWGRDVERVIYPPVNLYSGKLIEYQDRGNYFVAGAPFAENKGGEFLIECAKELKFNLKVIGEGRGSKRLKRLARGSSNIEFVGRISDSEKYKIMSQASGFLVSGIEDFGIFPVESISCGTPVLALKKGGYMESVVEGVNGGFYTENTVESFREGLERLVSMSWDIGSMVKSVERFSKERFRKEVEDLVRNSI
ncbi:glycosyltransferase [bacterium]|nr:glycosyltransferase [bacterium]